MGLFGGLTGGQPQISITSISAKVTGTGANAKAQFEMYLSNAGAGSDKIVKVEIIAGGESTATPGRNAYSTADPQLTTTDDAVIVKGNYKGWVTLTVTPKGTVAPGDTVILKLYFERSGIQTINVVVSP